MLGSRLKGISYTQQQNAIMLSVSKR